MRRSGGFVNRPHRGIYCGLARDLPPASGEGITSHNSMQHIAPQRSAGHRPCRRTPLAESGRIRRRCLVHPLWDVIASRSRDPAPAGRSRPQSCGSFRAKPRVVLFVTVADLRAGLFERGTLTARRGWRFNRRERWRGSCSASSHEA